MTALPAPLTPDQRENWQLTLAARFPGMRALAWTGDILYASCGYNVLRAQVSSQTLRNGLAWKQVGSFRAQWRRCLSVTNRLSSRLLRDGFHALAVLSSGTIVGAVPGAIVTLRPNETEFRVTHAITRGTRPLHITATPAGTMFWGEYFDNAARGEVHIYASIDSGLSWSVAYTFSQGAIRHVHNIVYDRWADCLWVLTGDYGDECRILRTSCDFRSVEPVLQGNQQARAVALVPTEGGLYFSSDTPLETNYIYRLDRRGELSRLSSLSSSSINGCRVAESVFFSTMVEPSEVNHDRCVRIFGSQTEGGQADERTAPPTNTNWRPLLAWPKDRWPMRFFQYGNAFFPDGENHTPYLALTTVAVQAEDGVMSLYSIGD
jgi:hypothetical protein